MGAVYNGHERKLWFQGQIDRGSVVTLHFLLLGPPKEQYLSFEFVGLYIVAAGTGKVNLPVVCGSLDSQKTKLPLTMARTNRRSDQNHGPSHERAPYDPGADMRDR